jgi:RNA polymerase sigma-70 factor (ECF subfamily)
MDEQAAAGRSDAELVAALRAEEPELVGEAFQELHGRFAAFVLSIAHGVTGDAQGAQDVCQNVFLKVFRRIGTLSDPDKLKSWLGHIARTTAIDWMRRRKHIRVSLEDLTERAGHVPEADLALEDDPVDVIAAIERRRLVLEAIEQLPRRYREVLGHKHIAQLSYQEISELTGLTVSAVESRLYRARAMLRRRLEAMHLLPDDDSSSHA